MAKPNDYLPSNWLIKMGDLVAGEILLNWEEAGSISFAVIWWFGATYWHFKRV